MYTFYFLLNFAKKKSRLYVVIFVEIILCNDLISVQHHCRIQGEGGKEDVDPNQNFEEVGQKGKKKGKKRGNIT